MFDLYVLSVAVMPIKPFMASIPYAFPAGAFDNGLVSMPWLELMDELKEIDCDRKWNAAKDVAFLQDALYAQIGAPVLDEFVPEVDPKPTIPKASFPPKRRGRGGLTR